MRCSIAAWRPGRRARSAHGQSGDDAQRQRDLPRRRQIGMAADEQQPQNIVAVMRAVEPLGERVLGIALRSEIPSSSGSGSRLRLRPMSSIATLRRP
jgi:hypothetical protein